MRPLKTSCLLLPRDVLTVAIAYGALLGGFAGKFATFKTERDTFSVGTVAYMAELVFACYAADVSVRACAFLHFGTFFASYSTNTDFH